MERRIKMDSDDRERRWTSSASVARIFLFQITARLLVKRLSMPVLFLVAGDDKIVDTKESIKVFKRLRVRDKNLIEYSDMYHSLSIDLGKERVFEDLLKWISDRIKI
jgi:alpha-beta hydrolase superfamily lysophospholipase